MRHTFLFEILLHVTAMSLGKVILYFVYYILKAQPDNLAAIGMVPGGNFNSYYIRIVVVKTLNVCSLFLSLLTEYIFYFSIMFYILLRIYAMKI